ncbi:MAG TPA: hypothetical protein VFY40_13080 [Blastocatellia bacterium]|nr:hypothetical protein [Blastocatellia bacterium]
MWNEEKQQLLDKLREKEFAGTLTSDEQEQLEQLFAEIDQEEAVMLQPFFERSEIEQQQMRKEIERLKKKNAVLDAIIEQEEQLLKRAKAVVQELLSEKQRLRAEYERALREESPVS